MWPESTFDSPCTPKPSGYDTGLQSIGSANSNTGSTFNLLVRSLGVTDTAISLNFACVGKRYTAFMVLLFRWFRLHLWDGPCRESSYQWSSDCGVIQGECEVCCSGVHYRVVSRYPVCFPFDSGFLECRRSKLSKKSPHGSCGACHWIMRRRLRQFGQRICLRWRVRFFGRLQMTRYITSVSNGIKWIRSMMTYLCEIKLVGYIKGFATEW